MHKLNIAYGDNGEARRNIDILTLKGNRSKVNEMLVKCTNIIKIGQYLDKIRNKSILCKQSSFLNLDFIVKMVNLW